MHIATPSSPQVLTLNESSRYPQSSSPPTPSSSFPAVLCGSQSEAALPSYPHQIPYMSGHCAALGENGHLHVLGGVNRHQYSSLKYPLVGCVLVGGAVDCCAFTGSTLLHLCYAPVGV
jgi:hypothetical protein